MVRWLVVALLLTGCVSAACAQESTEDGSALSLDRQRLELMRAKAMAFRFRGGEAKLPERVDDKPIFRYDDIPRGYVDGTIWRWGPPGRPLAIITAELHPNYLQSGHRVVYDLLSLAPFPFRASGSHGNWSPAEKAVAMKRLPTDVKPAKEASKRRLQMKRLVTRFEASQVVSEESDLQSRLKLRLLPRAIDSYQPSSDGSVGAAYLFVSGRMPGVILFLECDGQEWQYGMGRLSAPSTLVVTFDEREVYRVPPNFGTWSGGYNASNSTVKIPGY